MKALPHVEDDNDGPQSSVLRRQLPPVSHRTRPVALAVAAAVAAGTVGGCTTDPAPAAPGTTSSAGTSAAPAASASASWDTAPASQVNTPVTLTVARARTIEAEATSGDPARVSDALDVPNGAQVDPALTRSLHDLKAVHLDEATFRQVDDSSAIARMATTGADGASTSWTVTLVLRDGQWRVALTTKDGP